MSAPSAPKKGSKQTEYARRKLAAGWRRIPIWFSPTDLERLAVLAAEAGSEQEAVRRAVSAPL